MCEHCKTYKPLLDGRDRFYEKSAPIIQTATPKIQERRSSVSDNGCCSWRGSCCGGGCCDQADTCCTSPSVLYGHGRHHGEVTTVTQLPFQMTDVTPERVPCAGQEKKLPMCFGGDCKDSETEKCENDVTKILLTVARFMLGSIHQSKRPSYRLQNKLKLGRTVRQRPYMLDKRGTLAKN